jgi:hypothetical protein
VSKPLGKLIALIAPTLICAWSGVALSQPLPASTNGVHTSSAALPGAPLENSSGYPRVIQLMDRLDAPKGRLLAASHQRLYTSDDDGATWRFAITIPDPPGLKAGCCEVLFQLPRSIGHLWAGTLLYAADYISDPLPATATTPAIGPKPAIGYFISHDAGRTWDFQGTPVFRERGDETHGVFEPELEIANDGALVMFWSDQTIPGHNQTIMQKRTFDGHRWQDERETVASKIADDAPGMAVVSRLPNGHFFMTYEVSGNADKGAAHARLSSDGWDFGDPTDLGFRPTDHAGEYFVHTPYNAWARLPGSPNGALLLVGRWVFKSGGTQSPLSGKVLFINTNPDGTGLWTKLTAPVQVSPIQTKTIKKCLNYSPPLLPAPNGRTVLELAGAIDHDDHDHCVVFAGRGNLPLPAQ